MTAKRPKPSRKPDLVAEVVALKEVLMSVDQSYRRTHQARRSLALSFLQGTASALGAIATVVIVMPALVWTLRSVEWPPIVSGFIAKVINQIEQSNRPSPPKADGR